MKTMLLMIKRNVKLFFKDKGMFFAALITPAILLVLYATFLGKVYRDSFLVAMPAGFSISEGLLDGLVAAQLVSSILAVSAVTVSFCANFLMVQDKANGTLRDLRITPVRPALLSVSYYLATLCSSLLICLVATGLCLGYMAVVGWYLSAADIFLLLLDMLLLTFFGTALSSLVNFFLTSQGQISAVGTIVSSGYGFICGAYMPISSFGEGLQRVISFLPGTYGTALVRDHAMRGALDEMASEGVPAAVIEEFRDALDCNLYFFDRAVSEGAMYVILVGSTLLLLGAYILLNALKKQKT